MGTVPCRSCGKPIMFLITPKGHKMPVDSEGVEITQDDPHRTIILADGTTKKGVQSGEAGYTPHWQTCNEPVKFRRRKK